MMNTDFTETEIFLTEEERAAFRRTMACRAACEELIKRVVKEWEDSSISSNVIWSLIKEKYNLDFSEFDYEACNLTGRIKRRSKVKTAVKEFSDNFEKEKNIKSYFRKIFGMSKD